MRKISTVNYPLSLFLSDVWNYIAGFRRRLLFWFALYFVSALISLLTPVFTARLVDNLTAGRFDTLIYFVAGIFFVEYGRIVARNRIKFQVLKLAEYCRVQSRQNWVSKVLSFDLKWHESQNSGKKISIISRGSEQLRGLIRFVARGGGGIDIFINIVGIFVVFLTLDFKYAVLAFVNVAFYLLTIIIQTKTLNQKRHRLNQIIDRIVGKNFDFFSNMSLIKSLGISSGINRTLFKKETFLMNKTVKYTRLEYNKWIYINTISQVCTAVTLLFIISDITSDKISLGSFFIYQGYMNRLQDGLANLTEWIEDLTEKYLGLFRLRQLLNSGVTSTEGGSRPFPSPLSSITVDRLTFGYQNSRHILDNINLTLPAGKKYGFVGQSGSGKSTLGKLLLKLYLAQTGSIYFNNSPISQINSDSLHRHISVAPQESEIFNLSFRENITIASHSPAFNPRLYDLAVTVSECGPIVTKLKGNHRALLGEKGLKLSGGERQRLGIARAIYKNTPVMIFDESTSALDSKTEGKILQNLEKYFADKTIIWIAHRLSTLRFTDEIIVFEQGHIAEKGSFEELVNLKGLFYELWSIQKKTALN